MDWMWLLLGGALVFFMHSGFALLEVGSVSVRNTQNILFKNVVSPTVSAVLFWAFGYSIAYGTPDLAPVARLPDASPSQHAALPIRPAWEAPAVQRQLKPDLIDAWVTSLFDMLSAR